MKQFFLTIACIVQGLLLFSQSKVTISHQAIIRGNPDEKKIALVFSGDEYGEGLKFVRTRLKEEKIKASFFFTGRFYRNNKFVPELKKLISDRHYMGPHSDQHLLYCDWLRRDSLLVNQEAFDIDLFLNYASLYKLGFSANMPKYFLPPYEWYNDSIASWARQQGIQLISFSPGTLSHTDYTTLKDKNYRDNQTIYQSILDYESKQDKGLNGFILLMHIGAGPDRKEKFYTRLPELINHLKSQKYFFMTVNELLK